MVIGRPTPPPPVHRVFSLSGPVLTLILPRTQTSTPYTHTRMFLENENDNVCWLTFSYRPPARPFILSKENLLPKGI